MVPWQQFFHFGADDFPFTTPFKKVRQNRRFSALASRFRVAAVRNSIALSSRFLAAAAAGP